MTKGKIIVIIVAVVVVLVVGVIVLMKRSPQSYLPSLGGAPAAPKGPTTREAPPQNIVVPESASTTPKGVAAPTVVAPANVANTASYRSFNLKAENNAFTPNTVIVKQGDTTDINITAVDKDYDFTQPDYGFKEPLPKGQTKKIQFGATAAGKFTFYCASCGGPEKGPVGYIIIAPK